MTDEERLYEAVEEYGKKENKHYLLATLDTETGRGTAAVECNRITARVMVDHLLLAIEGGGESEDNEQKV